MANSVGRTIERFTPDGVGSVFASTGGNDPQGLAFDSAGNLYVAYGGTSTIERFSPDGADLGIFASSGLLGPAGLAFDSVGNLYVANFGSLDNTGYIERFTPDGVGSTFAAGSSWPGFIAIIPEPSTWALLGLYLPAFLAFRRRKARANTTARCYSPPNHRAGVDAGCPLQFALKRHWPATTQRVCWPKTRSL